MWETRGRFFLQYKKLAEKAFGQLAEDQLTMQLGEESSSVAEVVEHMAGNVRSRWTDCLTRSRIAIATWHSLIRRPIVRR